MNRIVKYSLLIGAVAIAGAGLSACKKDKKDAAADIETRTDEKPIVSVMTVDEKMVDQIGNYTATVEADKVNNISSNAPNRIKEIYVDDGQRVSKGQKLVMLDNVNQTANEIQVENAKTAVANAKANLATIKRDYDRAAELYKIGGGTKQAVDQMQLQVTMAQNQVETAVNSLRAVERTLQNSQENTVLTSPINGIVTARNYDPGDMTGALPILTIATINPVKVVINVTESDLSYIRRGMPATITFDTYGDETFNGHVAMVSPTVDATSRTFAVEVEVNNPNGRILPGMFARVVLKLNEAKHVVVPDKAVVKQPGSGNHYVYVYKDGKVTYNKVELGQRLGDTYELLSGVEPGSQVVVTGQSRLTNGMEVQLSK